MSDEVTPEKILSSVEEILSNVKVLDDIVVGLAKVDPIERNFCWFCIAHYATKDPDTHKDFCLWAKAKRQVLDG